jgi:hypothetical protein
MSCHDRAAQFAPYSALSGYEDAVEESARLTDQRIELDEYEKAKINDRLVELLDPSREVIASITYFVPDKYKSGGAYLTVVGEVGKFDVDFGVITMVGGHKINLSEIKEISIIREENEVI